jgi:Ser/Thr protein kinase RdoA (MazF antagonist)
VEEPAVTAFQTLALCEVARTDPAFPVPRVVPALDGALIARNGGEAGPTCSVRLFTWLDGVLLGGRVLAPAGLRDLGRTLARLAQALAGFSHPAERHPLLWDMQHAVALRPLLATVPDETARGWVARRMTTSAWRVCWTSAIWCARRWCRNWASPPPTTSGWTKAPISSRRWPRCSPGMDRFGR